MNRRTMDARLESILAALPDGEVSTPLTEEELPELLKRAQLHGLHGVLVDFLQDRGELELCEDSAIRLVSLHRLRRSHMDFALEQAAQALWAASIRACALKGPVLAERYYPEPRSRFSYDLDLLVSRAQLDSASDALQGAGYSSSTTLPEDFFREHHHHVHLVHSNGIPIELHFRAHSDLTSLEPNDLLERSLPYQLRNGAEVGVLEPEDEFLYLAAHASGHCFSQLLWVYDLKLMALRERGLEWSTIVERARSKGLAGALAFALVKARGIGAQVPPPQDVGLKWGIRQRVSARFSDLAAAGPSPLAPAARVVSLTLMCDSLRAAAAFLGRRRFRLATFRHRLVHGEENRLPGGAS